MKTKLITPPYEVSEIFLDWADECYNMSDKHSVLGNHAESSVWAETAVEIQKIGYDFIRQAYFAKPSVIEIGQASLSHQEQGEA